MFNEFNSAASSHEAISELASDSNLTSSSAEASSTDNDNNATSGFAAFALAPELMSALAALKFTTPTAVQERSIPAALEGGDWMVSSQTGSGKTAAFLLPLLQKLLAQMSAQKEIERLAQQKRIDEAVARGDEPPKKAKRKNPTDPRNFKAATPGAIVLCPTRELAQQVASDAIDLVTHCKGLRVATVVGGMPFGMQIAKLQNANLVVATPGRLLDLQRRGQLKLDQAQCLVVDEADRMLDLGFADDLAEVHKLTAQREQTLMFSATFAPRIMALAARVMREPGRMELHSAQQKHASITQTLHWADNTAHKRKLLDHHLRDVSVEQALVFVNTQVECDSLAQNLSDDGYSAVALHGAMPQGLRNRRLALLREARVQILVATDVAARGIDVPAISHVFNYGLPMKAEDYVHRIGRTGRAGRTGVAITFAEYRDTRRVREVEQFTRQPIKATVVPGLEPTPRAPKARGTRSDAPRNAKPGKPFNKVASTHNSQQRGFSADNDFSSAAPSFAKRPRFETRHNMHHDVRNETRHDVFAQDARSDSRKAFSKAAPEGKPFHERKARPQDAGAFYTKSRKADSSQSTGQFKPFGIPERAARGARAAHQKPATNSAPRTTTARSDKRAAPAAQRATPSSQRFAAKPAKRRAV